MATVAEPDASKLVLGSFGDPRGRARTGWPCLAVERETNPTGFLRGVRAGAARERLRIDPLGSWHGFVRGVVARDAPRAAAREMNPTGFVWGGRRGGVGRTFAVRSTRWLAWVRSGSCAAAVGSFGGLRPGGFVRGAGTAFPLGSFGGARRGDLGSFGELRRHGRDLGVASRHGRDNRPMFIIGGDVRNVHRIAKTSGG
jgi:hypothetical protein